MNSRIYTALILSAALGLAAPAKGADTAVTGWPTAESTHGPATGNGMLQWQKKFLTNEGLILLAQAGYGERFLLELIAVQPSKFDTSVEGLVFLAKSGLSERMVRAILQAQEREKAAQEAEDETAAPPAYRWKPVKRTVWVPEAVQALDGTKPPVKPGKNELYVDPRSLQDPKLAGRVVLASGH